jgi:preprotein translocase subunit SecA
MNTQADTAPVETPREISVTAMHQELAQFGIPNDGDTTPNKAVETHMSGEKIGRNDPCPCGSGKKFKKCGLLNTKEHQDLMMQKE